MHNAADDPAFIHSGFSRECRSADAVQAARIDRHSARNDLDPLQVPPSGTLNQKMRWLGIPFMGPHPKIEGTVVSARVYLEIEAQEGFSYFLWKFFDGR